MGRVYTAQNAENVETFWSVETEHCTSPQVRLQNETVEYHKN